MEHSTSNTIYQKLQKLVKEYEHLKKENAKLQHEIAEQAKAAKVAHHKVDMLEGQVTLLKNSIGKMDITAKKEMERRIGQYIKDIDTAIQLLNE